MSHAVNPAAAGMRALDLSCSGEDGESVTFSLPWRGAGAWFMGVPVVDPTDGVQILFECTDLAYPDGTPVPTGLQPNEHVAVLGYFLVLVVAGEAPTFTLTGLGGAWDVNWYTAWTPVGAIQTGQVVPQ